MHRDRRVRLAQDVDVEVGLYRVGQGRLGGVGRMIDRVVGGGEAVQSSMTLSP